LCQVKPKNKFVEKRLQTLTRKANTINRRQRKIKNGGCNDKAGLYGKSYRKKSE
jgi:hypothetical protein